MRSSHKANGVTKLLYLDDQHLPKAESTVISCIEKDGEVRIILDQTPMYVKRGGQPGDQGSIEGEGFSIAIRDVVYDESGDIVHIGKLQGQMPAVGDKVIVKVDVAARRLHSLWHSAGEAVIVAAKMAGFDEPVNAAIHYGPNQNRIEYQTKLDNEHVELLKTQIEANLKQIIHNNTSIAILNLTDKNEVIEHCGFWPEYLHEGDTIRVVKVRPDFTGRPCTGTHLAHTSELGKIWIEKIKVKGDKTIISYGC